MTEKEWRQKFAIRLQNVMLEKGMTESCLCVLSGLEHSSVWRYLHAQITPNVLSVLNLAKALGVSVDELVDFEESIDRFEIDGRRFYDDFRREIQ